MLRALALLLKLEPDLELAETLHLSLRRFAGKIETNYNNSRKMNGYINTASNVEEFEDLQFLWESEENEGAKRGKQGKGGKGGKGGKVTNRNKRKRDDAINTGQSSKRMNPPMLPK